VLSVEIHIDRKGTVVPPTTEIRRSTFEDAGSQASTPLSTFELRGIKKSYGGVHALLGVNFDVRPQEVHVLIGENGAGKSTLMNIMSGVVSSYDGTMTLSGNAVRFSSPSAAQRAGVATVFQELDLVPGLSVAANLFLGREPRRGPLVDDRAMRTQAEAVLARVGGNISPRSLTGNLRIGQQQAVAIAKALATDAKILILDEPTAALSSREVSMLFEVMRNLRSSGVGIVFISHRLDEVESIGDRVTVMRDGSIVATVPASTPQADLALLLTGRPLHVLFPPRAETTGSVRLRLDNFGFAPKRPSADWQPPRGVSFEVASGEIVGLVGSLGSGRTELLQTIFGASPTGRSFGVVEVAECRVMRRTPRTMLRRGVGFVTDDRRGEGMVTTLSISDNLSLSSLAAHSTWGVLRRRRLRTAIDWAFDQFGIKAASPSAAMLSMSGGNQQKVVIGRALLRRPQLLLLDEPTRGVDVGAKADIYRLVRSLAQQGLAVLVASSELPELTGWCDRLVVLKEGRVVKILDATTDPSVIMSVLDAGPVEHVDTAGDHCPQVVS
jgi:ribose transport system ATP-binding protein